MLRPTTVTYVTLDGGISFVSELLAIDVDMDGYLDLVGASLYLPYRDKSIPLFALLNDKSGSFEVENSLIAGATTHPREIVVADFNGDNINDLYVADHGYDAEPFPGRKNTLLLGKKEGGFTDASSRLPSISDFTHSADAADIDGDGDTDLFVGNINGGDSGPYFLVNNGSAVFTKTTTLPADVVNRIGVYTTSLFIDIDTDGDQDLFLGGDSGSQKLLLNDGTGRFTASTIPLPPVGFDSGMTSLDATPFDFDKDGRLDILLSLTKAYDNARLQVLVSDGRGGLKDVSAQHFDTQPTVNGWIKYVHYVDLNNDGALDIVGEVSGGQHETVSYLNGGNNRFFQMRPDALMPYGGLTLEFIDLDKDGKKELVQVAAGDGKFRLQIVKLTTSSGDVIGTNEADTVFGDQSSQKINGGAGADFLAGGRGNDTLIGGSGSDKLIGGSGADTASYTTAKSAVGASLWRPSSNTGDAKGDVYSSIERLIGSSFSDRLEGNGGANHIFGGAGNDRLYGEGGADMLIAGSGADALYGGTGADKFVFRNATDSSLATRDVIYDFSRVEGDRIYLATIDARTTTSGNQAFTFIGTADFSRKAGELRYLKKDGDTFVHADLNGDRVIDFSIRLDSTIDLKSTDFIL